MFFEAHREWGGESKTMWFLNPKYLEFYPKIYPLSEYPERHGHIEGLHCSEVWVDEYRPTGYYVDNFYHSLMSFDIELYKKIKEVDYYKVIKTKEVRMKIIKIKSCWKCPYFDHNVRECLKNEKQLPFTDDLYYGRFPSWCPLESGWEYVEHQLHPVQQKKVQTMIEKVSDAIMKYEEANGKKPQIIFLTSEQHKQIDREEKAKAGKEIVPGEEVTIETIYGIQIISDEVRALDLRYEKESS